MMDLSTVIIIVSVMMGLAQAVVTLRWYEPKLDTETPPFPIIEAVLFFVVFAIIFALLGWVIWTVGSLWEPYTRYTMLVLTPLCWVIALGVATERLPVERDIATRNLYAVLMIVVGGYPPLFVIIG